MIIKFNWNWNEYDEPASPVMMKKPQKKSTQFNLKQWKRVNDKIEANLCKRQTTARQKGREECVT